ncbi:S8 family peptidase [Uliginosibacterium flavum]|uniref:S8 family serine peptidase n=1 Tax=Uliginosibacterium flavum TaxID=1396831 RepID=A0ABV2TKW2_9RHOO
MPWIVKGAAMYTLHISAASDGASCVNGMSSSVLFVSGELVVKESVKSVVPSGRFGTQAMQATSNIPKLLSVPTSAMQASLAGLSTQASADPRDVDIQQAMGLLRYAKELMASGKYAYVEPNFRIERFSAFPPNDPNYSDQAWHYNQINLTAAMAKIAAIGTGSNPAPVVAVIDNGVRSSHPDLQGQIVDAYTFTASYTGTGGDDYRTEAECQLPGKLDHCGHGTMVAGVVAAKANNNLYGSGVAPMARIMAIREDDTTAQSVQGILYAAGLPNSSGKLPSHKADVINMSWGSGGECPQQLADAISQARANNVLVVAAAGNTRAGKITPPVVSSVASCPGVISVGALDIRKNRAGYSAYGPGLTLTAPGGYYDHRDNLNEAVFTIYSVPSINGWMDGFGANYGTSFSAPHVAGALALMRYVAPGITVAQVDTLITTGRLTDDLGVAGRDDEFGQGLINASKAVNEAYALASGGSIPGAVVPLPASINFGSGMSSTMLKLALTASSSETVSSIVASSPAITVTAAAGVNATTKLGDYTISVDRRLLPLGFSYLVLTVTTSARTFTVPLSVIKLSISTSPSATVGAVWVRASNLVTGTTKLQRVNVSGGRYSWSLTGMTGGLWVLSASTDLNNDGVYCNGGEVCGDSPGNGQSFMLGSNLTGLDFSMAPTLNTAATP